jgi:hypothetical protein
MDDYKLANMFDISRHIQQKINSPFRSAMTIYERARNNKNYYNINARSPRKNNGFEKAMYNSSVGLGLYSRYLIYSIMERCFRDQDNMY